MGKILVKEKLRELTSHGFVEVVHRGNAAIKAAVEGMSEGKRILIPQEGGWIYYETVPKEVGCGFTFVPCRDAKLRLDELRELVESGDYGVLLYQNPGGYFAEQNQEEIYKICQENNVVVIVDVSGSIGTDMCDGRFADIFVGSFGKWKLVEARGGGFISAKSKGVWDRLREHIVPFDDDVQFSVIHEKLLELPNRILKLRAARAAIVEDLRTRFTIVHPEDDGFVVVVKYATEHEKESLIKYCEVNELEWTQCPRYIRLNSDSISIEVKRL